MIAATLRHKDTIQDGPVRWIAGAEKGCEILSYGYFLEDNTIEWEDYEELEYRLSKAIQRVYGGPKYIATAEINVSGRNAARTIMVEIMWKMEKTMWQIIKDAGWEKKDKTLLGDPDIIELRANKVVRKNASKEGSIEREMVDTITKTILEVLKEYKEEKEETDGVEQDLL